MLTVLSDTGRALLVAMYLQGREAGYRCLVGGAPPVVAVGDRTFATTALDDLVQTKCATHLNRDIFILTEAGITEAKFLHHCNAPI